MTMPSRVGTAGGRLLLQHADLRVSELVGRVYVVDVYKHLTKDVMATALKSIWASPNWRQPWGMVLVMAEGATYNRDILQHEMPPNDKRGVGASIVSNNQLHRVVVKSAGLGYGMVSRFILTAHATLEQGIEAEREKVRIAEILKRPY
jgi:hypothetical protein